MLDCRAVVMKERSFGHDSGWCRRHLCFRTRTDFVAHSAAFSVFLVNNGHCASLAISWGFRRRSAGEAVQVSSDLACPPMTSPSNVE